MSASPDSSCLVFNGHRGVTTLLKKLGHCSTTGKLLLSCSVQVGTELGKCSELAICSEVKAQRTSNGLHGLHLSGAANAGYGDTNVNSRTLTLIEQVGGEVNLTVGN